MRNGCELVDSTAIQPVIPRLTQHTIVSFDTISCNDVLCRTHSQNLMVFSSHVLIPAPEFSVLLARLIIMLIFNSQSPSCRISASCCRITVTVPSEERRWLAARCCCGATQGRFRPCQPNSRPRQSKSSAHKVPLVGRRSMVPGRQ